MFRDNEIIVLLGAGSSADAGIPVSTTMIDKLESLLKTDLAWKTHLQFYNLVKSAILYSDGIQGVSSPNFDIERLVNVLSELEKRENSILYPFVGSWIPRLMEVATYDFQERCKSFKEKILEELKQWVTLGDYSDGRYYKKLFDFQQEYNYSLRVFSLNYDLCIEKNTPENKEVVRGFDNKTHVWSWKPYEQKEEYELALYLYKLHGSIDWEREDNLSLREVDNLPKIPDLIFGTNYKMQYVDPYLFYAYEFRKYSLESKIIITIGYSFRDEHINGILDQALRLDAERRVIMVSPDADKLHKQLGSSKQYISVKKKAKEFFDDLTLEYANSLSSE